MEMFDISQIIDLIKVEPGHGFMANVLLFMIWLKLGSIRKSMEKTDNKVENHEGRIIILEKKTGVSNG